MRTIVALWHAFWQSFEVQRAQDALMRVQKEQAMKDLGITLPCLVITAEDALGRKVAIWGRVEDRKYMLQTIERGINGDDNQDASKVKLHWRIVKEEPIDWPPQEIHHD